MSLGRLDYYKYLFNVYGLNKGTITKSWHGPSVVDISEIEKKPVTGAYPIDFSQDDSDTLLTDENGIPKIDYSSLGIHYNPWFIGHIALGRYSKWMRSGDDKYLLKFIKLADWFVATGENTKNGITWLYHFDWFKGHSKPWRSGLSQAHAVSTLLRAASITNNSIYEKVAQMAVEDMIAPILDEGTAYYWNDGSVSFEESILIPPSSIINGHLFSVFACWEASRYFSSTRYKEIAEKGWKFVLNRIEQIDLGFWSRYSFKNFGKIPDIASNHYHDVHIAQLRVSAAITGNSKFDDVARRFQQYQESRACRLRALWLKRIAKLI